ncbi:MAG: hypothetical protein H0X24_21250 [Ktedonobacterales bacterium]|nr:hypothetical protein [Ktedonobacterales bacterium]
MEHVLTVVLAAVPMVITAVVAWRWARLAAKAPPTMQPTLRASALLWTAITLSNGSLFLYVLRS